MDQQKINLSLILSTKKNSNDGIRLCRIAYKEVAKQRVLTYLEHHLRTIKRVRNRIPNHHIKADIDKHVCFEMVQITFLFKDSSWEHEKEARLIVYDDYLDNPETQDSLLQMEYETDPHRIYFPMDWFQFFTNQVVVTVGPNVSSEDEFKIHQELFYQAKKVEKAFKAEPLPQEIRFEVKYSGVYIR